MVSPEVGLVHGEAQIADPVQPLTAVTVPSCEPTNTALVIPAPTVPDATGIGIGCDWEGAFIAIGFQVATQSPPAEPVLRA
jgi:hypothetical protein